MTTIRVGTGGCVGTVELPFEADPATVVREALRVLQDELLRLWPRVARRMLEAQPYQGPLQPIRAEVTGLLGYAGGRSISMRVIYDAAPDVDDDLLQYGGVAMLVRELYSALDRLVVERDEPIPRRDAELLALLGVTVAEH